MIQIVDKLVIARAIFPKQSRGFYTKCRFTGLLRYARNDGARFVLVNILCLRSESVDSILESTDSTQHVKKDGCKMPDKVDYWLDLCDDDLEAAKAMLLSKNFLWAGFICHLIAEKAIKAVISNITNDVPPKIHHLARLAERAEITEDLSIQQQSLLKELNPLNIEARNPQYKERIAKTLTAESTARLLTETEDFLCWIKKRLGK